MILQEFVISLIVYLIYRNTILYYCLAIVMAERLAIGFKC